MLSISFIAPGHQMFVPAIAGPVLQELEVGVNILLKLALKIKAEDIETLVLITPGLPVYHHRFGMSHAAQVMRVFESNMKEGDVLEISFPGADSFLNTLESRMMEEKLPLEYITHQAGAVAIDNICLSLLYFLQQAGSQCDVLFVSTSDLSVQKHEVLGGLIAQTAEQVQKKVAIGIVGSIDLFHEQSSALLQEHVKNGTIQDALLPEFTEMYLSSGQQLFLPLSMLKGVHHTQKVTSSFHYLGEQFFDQKVYPGGYWQ